uniref:Putative Dbl-like domain-containing protein n=1 Tax=Moniliophthora roreri TaxID=221103 RepID=A0A0W0F0H3_MONRR
MRDDTKTVLRHLEAILQDENEYRHLLAQRGELAQSLLDLLQTLSNSPQASSQLRSSILKAVLRLSRKSNLYPQCLTVENIRQRGEHPVASGGFGEIWMGEVEGSDQVVCLKVVKLYLESDIEKVLKSFLREAIVWRQLDHPNLLPFLGLYFLTSSRQRLCLISPWMENGNLIQFLERTPRSDVDHCQLVWDVANGLRYLHQMKIVHSDLKGVNILMTESRKAIIGDFGLSYVAEGEVLRLTSTSTFSGGTTRWLAPELLNNESRPSYKSDIYAFGCVCYEIYSGLRPFHHLLYDAAVLLQVMQGNRPSRPQNRPELSDEMPGIEEIYQSIDSLFGAIEAAPAWESSISEQIWSTAQTPETPLEVFTFLSESHRKLQIRGRLREAAGKDDFSDSLIESEMNRQINIYKLISEEERYIKDLEVVEAMFITPLRQANPPIISNSPSSPSRNPYPSLHAHTPTSDSSVDSFIDTAFNNILDLRECNKRLLEMLYVREQEQDPVIQCVGDIFLDAATEFRVAYPIYIGGYVAAEKKLGEEAETNPEWRMFVEQSTRKVQRQHKPASHGLENSPSASKAHVAEASPIRFDLKHYLKRPIEHLQKYPILLETILNETAEGNPDAEYLREAIESMRVVQSIAKLWTFQASKGRQPAGQWEWFDLAGKDATSNLERKAKELGISEAECKRQSIIFELIKQEMKYVKDLGNIDVIYIRPLRNAEPPIIPPDRIDQFVSDVFHNFHEIYAHHWRMLEKFHEIQREEHPVIKSIAAALFDAALGFRDAYLEYIPNYPIAEYRIDEEKARNPTFKKFVEDCTRNPEARRLDMKNFINMPISRLLRYQLLLKGILDETSPGHEDQEDIPQVLETIKALGKDIEPGVASAKQKVELWRFNSNFVFKPGEFIDLHLLDENRSLVHSGKLLRQHEVGLNAWSELFVLLFDNYLIMTKVREKDDTVEYYVNSRPIPLGLLTLVNFTDPPTNTGISNDVPLAFPFTIRYDGRVGAVYTLYAESAQVGTMWKNKLGEAIELEPSEMFEIDTLSTDTFLSTGKVTCSVPFNTSDGRELVAIGCAEGVWIGFRRDPRSMRRVLHLRMVTQCAMLEDFGIFLILADKSLFAYHIEALVPSSPASQHAWEMPQRLSGSKDVDFFSIGTLQGRTLVVYVKKKSMESVFYVVEPVIDKIKEVTKAPARLGSRFGFRTAKSDWFRPYQEFFLPSESFDLIFLNARIAIMCTRGFEILDLSDLQSVTIPQTEDPRFAGLAKRCESCRPLGMFRATEEEFLLCYSEFGLYVNRHGDPSRSNGLIEWEGTAERAALHSPYILLFDTGFIEIRHVQTGCLAQIIRGSDLHCLWNKHGTDIQLPAAPLSPATPHSPVKPSQGQQMDQVPRVHGVMRASRRVQHVFQLVPTIPSEHAARSQQITATIRLQQFEDPALIAQVNKLADLLPHVERNILAGYLRRAGHSDILAIGQYLEDERNDCVRQD